MRIFFVCVSTTVPPALRHRPDGTFPDPPRPRCMCMYVRRQRQGILMSWRAWSGAVLEEVHPAGGGGAAGEGQHADARGDRLLAGRGRVEAVHHGAGVEPQHGRHPRVQQQGGVHKQVHHSHRYVCMCMCMYEVSLVPSFSYVCVSNTTNINAGDDCVSIVTGSTFVRVSSIFCGPGHGIRYIRRLISRLKIWHHL